MNMAGNFDSSFPVLCPDDFGELQALNSDLRCSRRGRLFPSGEGLFELLPRESLLATSPESLQLNAYRASFSNRPESAWRRAAGAFLNVMGNGYLYCWARRSLEEFARGRKLNVLDAACGDGVLRNYLPSCHSYVGIDFSSRLLARAQRYYPACYFRADLNHLPFPDAAFDVVLSLQALHYLDRPELALAQIARFLNPGGRLLLSVPNDESFKYRLHGIPHIQLQRFDQRSLPR